VFCLFKNRLRGLVVLAICLCQLNAVAFGQAAESRAEPVSVFPAEVGLVVNGRQQLVVQQRLASGRLRDLSRVALFSSSDPSG
jgi:hypothetical protein